MTETLFYRLLVTVDDFGRADARPAMVKALCFPIKESVTAAKCAQMLAELVSNGLAVVYVADGKTVLQMLKWDNKPRASSSLFPAPDDECIQAYTDVCKPRTLLPVTGTVTGTGTEAETETETKTKRKPAQAPFVLPDWIDLAHWDAWHSSTKRKKATAEQKHMAVSKLSEWRESGQDFAGALENAAVGGYQGLFLPDKAKQSATGETAFQRTAREKWELVTGRNKQTGVIYDDAELLG